MFYLGNTRNAYHEPASFFPYYRPRNSADKRALIRDIHAALRAARLAPYNPLWPWEMDPILNANMASRYARNWANTMAVWFNGAEMRLPDEMQHELEQWAGLPVVIQHIGKTIYMKDSGILIGDVPWSNMQAWKRIAAKFYRALDELCKAAGVLPYIHVDEPPIAFAYGSDGKTPHAAAWQDQPLATHRLRELAEVVTANSDIKIGPTLTSGWKAQWWRELGVKWNWWLWCDDDAARRRGAGWRLAHTYGIQHHEHWFYYTAAEFLRPGHEDDIEAYASRMAQAQARGVLMWACARHNDVTGQTSLFDPPLPQPPTRYNPTITPNGRYRAFANLCKNQPLS